MRVPQQILEKWASIRSPEDSKIIHQNLIQLPQSKDGLRIETVRLWLKHGNCPDYAFVVISKYYTDKAKTIEKVKKELNKAIKPNL